MLAETILIVININQWSNILRRTLEPNLVSHTHIYNKYLSKVFLKSMIMSKEDDKYNLPLDEMPSASGSSTSNWEHNDMNRPNFFQNPPVEYIPNFVLPYSVLPLQNLASNLYHFNYYHTNNYYYMNECLQQNVSRQYSHNRGGHRIRNVEQRNGPPSKNQSCCPLLLLIIVLFTCVSHGVVNCCEEKNNDRRLLTLRGWQNVSSVNRNNKPGFIFTLMCYNVLSQDLLVQHPYLYHHHDKASLQWEVRWNNIFNEITEFKPDILCLQEVQQSHIDNYFSVLETLGYSSLYKRRTGERTDGCALYYKTDLIHLVEHTSVEFFQPNVTVLNRDNVGLIAKFSPKLHSTREFVVATTHLLYNPRRQDVRLAQMQLLITEIERLSYKPESRCNYLPVILTGDLNSTPESSVYEFITNGNLKYENLSPKALQKGSNTFMGKILIPPELRITDNCQHVDLLEKRSSKKRLSRSEELALIKLFHSEKGSIENNETKEETAGLFSTGTLSHNFAFKSVYNHGHPEDNEGTTFQGEWLTVDYIFYSANKDNIASEDKLKLLSRYRLPTKTELIRINIPNSVVGSDHLSLMAKFKLDF